MKRERLEKFLGKRVNIKTRETSEEGLCVGYYDKNTKFFWRTQRELIRVTPQTVVIQCTLNGELKQERLNINRILAIEIYKRVPYYIFSS